VFVWPSVWNKESVKTDLMLWCEEQGQSGQVWASQTVRLQRSPTFRKPPKGWLYFVCVFCLNISLL